MKPRLSWAMARAFYKKNVCVYASRCDESYRRHDLQCVSEKKFPLSTFKLSVTLWNLNGLSKFLHCWNAPEICYKTVWHYPSHLRHVARLLGKLKIQIICRCGRKRKQIALLIASNFVIHPQMLIFSVFEIASLSPYCLQIKLFMSLFF